jgi:hypothetical protein
MRTGADQCDACAEVIGRSAESQDTRRLLREDVGNTEEETRMDEVGDAYDFDGASGEDVVASAPDVDEDLDEPPEAEVPAAPTGDEGEEMLDDDDLYADLVEFTRPPDVARGREGDGAGRAIGGKGDGEAEGGDDRVGAGRNGGETKKKKKKAMGSAARRAQKRQRKGEEGQERH